MPEKTRKAIPLQHTLSNALDKHFFATIAVASAAVAGTGLVENAEGAIVYSGAINAPLPAGSGIYINLVTKTDGGSPGGSPGWDINPYVGASSGNTADFAIYTPGGNVTNLVAGPTVGGSDTGAKLAAGTMIGPTSTFTTAHYPGPILASGTNAGPWYSASTGSDFLGLEFTEAGVNGGNTIYGWMRITKGVGATAAANIDFVDWAYDDSGAAIAAGATSSPEPASLSLLAAGAIGLMGRRGKVKLRHASV